MSSSETEIQPAEVAPGAGQKTVTAEKAAKPKRFVYLRGAKSMTGLIIFAFYLLIAVIGPWIAPDNPSGTSQDTLQPPSLTHLLGTTNVGADIFSQVVVSAREVMLVGLISGVIATILSAVIGITAGFLGGAGDEVLSMLTNIFLVIPGLPLIIVITSAIGAKNSILTIMFVLGLTSWAWGARVLRSQTMSLRNRDFVEAARANGESRPRIIFFEILPNLTAILASSFIGTVTATVLSLVTLSYIGVVNQSDWNWGTILYQAQSQGAFQQGAWWWFAPAGLLVAGLGMALALINFGIDEFVNPRLRSTGMNASVLKKRGIRPRIGFTPVARTDRDQSGRKIKKAAADAPGSPVDTSGDSGSAETADMVAPNSPDGTAGAAAAPTRAFEGKDQANG